MEIPKKGTLSKLRNWNLT